MTKQPRTFPLSLVTLFAVVALAFAAQPAAASTRNGSIGVAHVVDMFALAGCGGQQTIVVVTTDEDFEDLSRSALTGSPRPVQILGTGYYVKLGRVRDGHWISGRDQWTGQAVLIVNQRHARRL